MDEVYEPPRRLGLAFNLGIALLMLIAVFSLLIIGSGSRLREPNLMLLLAAVPCLLLFFFLIYRVFLLTSTRYVLSSEALEIRWGFRREIIPLVQIEWVHPVSDFESPMPLPGFLLPGQFFGVRQIRGLGAVEFVACDKPSMVLIRAEARHFVISPSEARGFADNFERLSGLGAAEGIRPASENLTSMLGAIIQDKTAKMILILSFAFVLLLAAVAALLSATRAEILWVTLERVSSDRLLLLALVGVLIWLVNGFVGAYFFLRELVAKRWVYLVWAWSAPVCLILILAAVFMSLGVG